MNLSFDLSKLTEYLSQFWLIMTWFSYQRPPERERLTWWLRSWGERRLKMVKCDVKRKTINWKVYGGERNLRESKRWLEKKILEIMKSRAGGVGLSILKIYVHKVGWSATYSDEYIITIGSKNFHYPCMGLARSTIPHFVIFLLGSLHVSLELLAQSIYYENNLI